ncbi:hypothetical protein LG288_05305 [Idiomarina seosinensis]|uniref:hypothetical protein n=1 Tax=Idiomarina seosinensis TaxID=281739 RepID=UPI00384AE7E1
MEKLTKGRSNWAVVLVTTALMYLALGLLALSPIVIIWLAAGWLHDLFSQSTTFFSSNPRLYTVLTIIGLASAVTLVADKLYQRIKAHHKHELEHF